MGNWSDGTPVTELEVFPKITGIEESVTQQFLFTQIQQVPLFTSKKK